MPHGGAAYLGLFRREKFGERTNVLHLISLVREMGVTLTTTPRLASHADVLRLAMERVRSLGTSALDATPRPVPRVVLSSPSDFSRRSNPSGAPLPNGKGRPMGDGYQLQEKIKVREPNPYIACFQYYAIQNRSR